MDNRALTTEELTQFFKDMGLGSEQTIMAIDGSEDSVMPDLAMGVIKNKYFDSDTTTYLAGVYGDKYNFCSFFVEDYDDEEECIKDLVEWLTGIGIGLCGANFNGLYIKPSDEEEQTFYEENKYNGEIARTIDTLEWGEVDMVARFDYKDELFYDCYQKDSGKHLGEYYTGRDYSGKEYSLDDFSDREIEEDLSYNIHQ